MALVKDSVIFSFCSIILNLLVFSLMVNRWLSLQAAHFHFWKEERKDQKDSSPTLFLPGESHAL